MTIHSKKPSEQIGCRKVRPLDVHIIKYLTYVRRAFEVCQEFFRDRSAASRREFVLRLSAKQLRDDQRVLRVIKRGFTDEVGRLHNE